MVANAEVNSENGGEGVLAHRLLGMDAVKVNVRF